ncbi:initiation-specific alpha-1,6-mannosyltransferase [Rhypophila sp. PSN 637]
MIAFPRPAGGIFRHIWKILAVVFTLIILNLVYLQFQLRQSYTTPLTMTRPPASEIPIPRQIWQIFFASPTLRTLDKTNLYSTRWVSMAPGYTYTLISDLEASTFIDNNFKSRPEIAKTYHALKNPALKSDFTRYLLLLARGGTYSDTDTKPIVPLEEWLAPEKRRDMHLVIAPEYDESQDPHPKDWMHPVQFCQWTISAAPGHPILERMVNRTINALHWVAAQQGVPLEKADISDFNVLNSTGPVAWTEVVLESLKEMDPNIKGFEDFYHVDRPRYYKDVAVLPLESFRADWMDEYGLSWRKPRRALVRHYFKGAWRQIPLD